jgi:hypothetical protein
MQAALVEVPLRNGQAAVERRTLDECILAVQHDVIMHIAPLVDPVAADTRIGTLDGELVQHVLEDLGRRQRLFLDIHLVPTCRARLEVVLLRGPAVVQALAAEVVVAGEADGAVEGRMADEADEVAVAGGDVVELVHVGRDLGDAALAKLRRW